MRSASANNYLIDIKSITDYDMKNILLAVILFIQPFIKIKILKKIFNKKNIRPIKSLFSLFHMN